MFFLERSYDQRVDSTVTQLEQALGPVVGTVQTDTFCETCGYNLLTQAVMRDARLGILVCRCPECGRYHAAGKISSAARVWLNRLGTSLLFAWVVFLLLSFGLCALFFGMLAYGHTVGLTQVHTFTEPNPHFYGQSRYVARYDVYKPSPDDPETDARRSQDLMMFTIVTGCLSLLTGGAFSTFCWHLRGWRRYLIFFPALLGCGIDVALWVNDPMTEWVRHWGVRQIGYWLLFELAGITVGIFIGRPVARGVLRILLPARVRQHLAFLWITDGKVLKPG